MWIIGKIHWHEFEPLPDAPEFEDAAAAEAWARAHMEAHPETFVGSG